MVFVSHHGAREDELRSFATQQPASRNQETFEQLRTLRNAWFHGNPSDHIRQALLNDFTKLRTQFDEWSDWVAATSDSLNEPFRVLLNEFQSSVRVRVPEEAQMELHQAFVCLRGTASLLTVKEEEWTAEQNHRRCELIDKEIEGTLIPNEADELEQLQNAMLAYRRKLAPLPLKEARELHQALLQKARKQTDPQ
jgi:hypothetical protein